MKRFLFVSVFGLVLAGCGSIQDSADLRPFTTTWSTVGPEYRAMLEGKPPTLSADQVAARKLLCDELDAIVARRAAGK